LNLRALGFVAATVATVAFLMGFAWVAGRLGACC
jgi:hypothetical protein